MQIFVIHYAKLAERRKNMVMQLIVNDLDAEFITQYDRSSLLDEDKRIFRAGYSDADKAITLSHIYCYKQVSDRCDYALILEDDAVFNNQFRATLDNYITQLPADWDMVFIGDGCNLHIPYPIVQAQGGNIFKKCLEPTPWGGNGATRCTDSYLISKKCAARILNYVANPDLIIDGPIDWWLNDVCRKCQFQVYWAEPTIVTQGSVNMFQTSRN